MADYEEYKSTGGTYNFSKGPKSLYEPDATGDYITDGVVLNVPQTDEDDEWGGTERIAVERIADAVARLESDVEDPVGGIGLLSKMLSLIGATVQNPLIPSQYPLINLNAPSLTLGNIQINVNTDKITIGTGLEITETSLKIGTKLNITTTTDSANIEFKNTSATGCYIHFADNLFGTSLTLTSGSDSVIMGSGALTLSPSLTLSATTITASITLNAATINVSTVILPTSGSIIIGGPSNPFNIGYFNSVVVNTSLVINTLGNMLCFGPITAGSSNPNIGATAPTERFGTLYCKAVNISKTTTGALLTLTNTVAGVAIAAGSSNLDIGDEFGPFRAVYALSGEFTTDIHPSTVTPGTTDIGQSLNYFRSLYIKSISVETTVLPKVTNTVDIGSPGVRFKDLYLTGAINAADLTLSNTAIVTNGISTLLGGISSGADLTASGDIFRLSFIHYIPVFSYFAAGANTNVYHKLIGKRVFVDFYLEGTTTTGAAIIMTLPPYAVKTSTNYKFTAACRLSITGGSTWEASPASILGSSAGNTVTIYSTFGLGSFPVTTSIILIGNFQYEMD